LRAVLVKIFKKDSVQQFESSWESNIKPDHAYLSSYSIFPFLFP